MSSNKVWTAALPPLEACSEEDVESFQALEGALRSHVELAREGPSLQCEKLAELVRGAKHFSRQQLGHTAKTCARSVWPPPLVQIPEFVWRDRTKSGPLFVALLAALRVKKESIWRTFDFYGEKRHDDNMGILRRMDQDLRKAGFLPPIHIYLDDTCQKKQELSQIALQFGATVVTDATLATHVVAHDDETDRDDLIQAERALETAGQPMDKLYLRTVARHHDDDSKALVHWWFWPASYDEWMPAADVSGAAPEDHHQSGAWVVSCRFLRDVARYNEWGVEADYTIQNYETKVALYKTTTGVSSSASRTPGKKKNLKKRERSKSPAVASSAAAVSAAAVSAVMAPKNNKLVLQLGPRDRRGGRGMNPRWIATGLYGPRGERIRRSVHDGALRIPPESQQLLVHYTHLISPQNKHELPSLDAIVRPSLDPCLPHIRITQLMSNTTNTTPPTPTLVPATPETEEAPSLLSTVTTNLTTLVTHRTIPILLSAPTERIRGGGDNDDNNDNDKQPVTPATNEINDPLLVATSATSTMEMDVSVTPTPISAPPPTTTTTTTTTTTAEPMKVDDEPITVVQPPQRTTEPMHVDEPITQETESASTNNLNVTSSLPVVANTSIPTPSTVPSTITQTEEPALTKANPAPAPTAAYPLPPTATSSQSTPIPAMFQPPIPMVPPTDVAPVVSTTAPVAKPTLPATPSVASATPVIAKPPIPTPSVPIGLAVTAQKTEPAGPSLPVVTAAPTTPKAPTVVSTSTTTKAPTIVSTSTTTSVPIVAAPLAAKTPSSAPATTVAPAPVVSATTTPVSSGSPATAPTVKPNMTPMQPLPNKRPLPQWQQQPTTFAADASDPVAAEQSTIATPSWYSPKEASDFEERMFPEWFDGSAAHRTPESLVQTRESILDMAKNSHNRYVTVTAIRRSIAGDFGSLLRLHKFLNTFGFINGSAIGESTPADPGIRAGTSSASAASASENSVATGTVLPYPWTDTDRQTLVMSVVEHANKKQKLDQNEKETPSLQEIDWEVVAATIGSGATPTDCQREFLAIPMEEEVTPPSNAATGAAMERSITPDNSTVGAGELQRENKQGSSVDATLRKEIKVELMEELLEGARPDAMEAAIGAAFQVTQNGAEAQKAALVGTLASHAMERAHAEEATVDRLLMELLDQRMEKLEHRVSLLEDVEGMLEAERVALEIERRDLYTARCRHWFGNGN